MMRIYRTLSKLFENSWPLHHRMAAGLDLITRPVLRSCVGKHTVAGVIALILTLLPEFRLLSPVQLDSEAYSESLMVMALALGILSCSNIDVPDGWQDCPLRRHLAG